MHPTTPKTIAGAIEVPDIESDEPVAVIPTASVAPPEGSPDGERINTFTLAPQNNDQALEDFEGNAFGGLRGRVLGKPLAYAAIAFSLGFFMARVLR